MAPLTLDPVYASFLEMKKRFQKHNKNNTTEDQDIYSKVKHIREMSEKAYIGRQLAEIIEQEKTVVYNGIELHLTIFRPVGSENEVLPAVIFFHGGGFIMGSKNMYGKNIRDISTQNHVAVVYIELTLAPEAKYPLMHNEGFSTLAWVFENGQSINIDVNKLAVIGDSAGGLIVTAVSLMAKERGLGEAIKALVLIYPATGAALTRQGYESCQLFGTEEYGLSAEDSAMLETLYLGVENMENDKHANLFLNTSDDLKGLPPTLLLTAEADMLRDEGEAFARKLIDAGNSTCAIRILGTIHAFLCFPLPETPPYRQTMALIKQQLNQAFNDQK
ncbi:Alpha/Beta hydrolase protein [Phascolomyces articulosus]|uniref:Alpha/Beta hydrolase protein n=1 Tax=Phascolomyces articulosus TaxID=60185 RepID=A0AAD5PCS7_9FUNG|nr:Alpha/Beta hydrolase protein [Phascolomyces articulosus]